MCNVLWTLDLAPSGQSCVQLCERQIMTKPPSTIMVLGDIVNLYNHA